MAIELKLSIIATLLLVAVLSDLWTYKIKNLITYGFMLIGIIVNVAQEGFRGMLFSIQGIGLPVACLMVLYVLRVIGAGDVKLISAVGAVMGPVFIIYASAYTFICGGCIALLIILIRRNGIERLRHILTYIKSCFLSKEILQYADFTDKEDEGRFHFSIAIAAGTFTAMLTRGF